MSAARGCSPTERMRSPAGVLNTNSDETTTSASASQIIRFICPNAPSRKLPISGMWPRKVRWTSGISGMSDGVPFEP